MRFSVVIPTYNREKYIANTLESVFNQSFQDFEIIIVDNCSTDGTVKLVEELMKQNDKIKLIKNSKNLERSRARNIGIENSLGDYITLLDSDDFLYENCLEDANNFLIKNPDIKIFHNYYELIDSNKVLVYKYIFPKNINNYHLNIIKANFLSCIGVFVEKNVLKEYKFDENDVVIGSED